MYTTFGVKTDALEKSVWIEPINHSRDLRRPKSIQSGMLEFNPRTVETITIAKFCSMMGTSQRFVIMELDSIEMVWSQGVLQEFQESKDLKTVMNEIMELILEPPGSKLLIENKRVSTPRVGMSSEKLRSSCPKPKISDTRV